MKRLSVYLIIFTVVLAWIEIGLKVTAAAAYGTVPRISVEALKDKLNEPALVILDVRLPSHIEAGTYKIRGAVWVNPADVDKWSQFFDRDAIVVLY